MKSLPLVLVVLMISISCGPDSREANRYDGEFCTGEGDADFLRLIDESFAFFSPNPAIPNLTMVYKPEWDTFVEGAGWDAWWIQNSYGFSYSATPFLQEPWFSTLQRSWDLHWDNQGDGKRMSMWGGSPTGSWFSHLVAPDGSLGDMARPNEIGFKQGDGDQNVHDWFYEATAAGVVMQAEILLASRDLEAIHYYLPKMERACNFIEKTRDPKNNLFLVGPACNLLAPSYGGVSYRRLDEGSLQWPCPSPEYPGTPILHVEMFTRGKGLFVPLEYKPSAELPDKEYPLLLTTERSLFQYHTGTMTRKSKGLNTFRGEELVEVNPKDAKELGINDGAMVKVISRRGEVVAKVKVTEVSPAGVISMSFHFAESPTNKLTNPAFDPVAKIPEFKVCAVRVEKTGK